MVSIALRLLLFAAFTAAIHRYADHHRYRRQIESQPPLDLNVTVPYIFSARLYPFGASRGDIEVVGDEEAYRPENPIHFMGELYNTVYIRRDGSIGFSSIHSRPGPLPSSEPTIAVFWTKFPASNVHFRETTDIDILNLAHNEVNIQYRYGSQFHVKSVIIVTWEGISGESQEVDGNLFQLALIIGHEMTFAHFVYSRLVPGTYAISGFSSSSSVNNSFSLPDSASVNAHLLVERSDIGIPGEWLFRVDDEQVFLCGAGFKGLECVESCAPSQWSNDCYRSCHCEGGDSCDHETGRCPSGRCSPGWRGEPICDKDKDECESGDAICPAEQPDCLNTPGSFLCLCFEYDEKAKTCKGAPPRNESEIIAVDVMPIRPSFGRPTTRKPPVRRPSVNKSKNVPTISPTVNFMPEIAMPSTQIFTTTTSTTTTTPESHTDICDSCDARADCIDGECHCEKGWEGDGFSCVDEDECSTTGICGPFAICRNTPGSFDCDCRSGFHFINGTCSDVDECQNSPCGLGSGVRCVNVPGSFVCECDDGYEGNPSMGCADVNECKQPDACGPNAKCTNTIGGYECECMKGFERLTENGNCTDIDECIVEPCHAAARCTNLPGSYNCSCIHGFIGDGLHCHEMQLYPIANDSVVVPRKQQSSLAINLPRPLLFFGRRYSTAYLSSNGLISFKKELNNIVEEPEKSHSPAIFALHTQMDYSKEGLVAYTFVNESDEAGESLLSRARIAAETQFGLESFHPKELHIFTFDRLKQAGSDHVSSFQTVVACSEDATVLLLIYQNVEAKGAISGVSSSKSFHSLMSTSIASQSNVGQPGRWMMRVDGLLEPCPAGKKNAPLCGQECSPGSWGFGCSSSCHCAGGLPCDFVSGVCSTNTCAAGWQGEHCDQDLDECSDGIVSCAEGSECFNNVGGYECRCRQGFRSEGNRCTPIDACLSRFGRGCDHFASCRDALDGPICVCQRGYHGDGFKCEQDITLPSLLEPNNDGTNNQRVTIDEHPFVMSTWQPPRSTTKKRPILVTVPTIPSDSTQRSKVTVPTITNSPEEVDKSSIHPIMFVIPTILCVIVLLIVITVAFHKRNKRKAKEFDGVWKTRVPRRTDSRSLAVHGHHPNVVFGPMMRHYEGY